MKYNIELKKIFIDMIWVCQSAIVQGATFAALTLLVQVVYDKIRITRISRIAGSEHFFDIFNGFGAKFWVEYFFKVWKSVHRFKS